MKLSIVIPAYNEEQTIEKIIHIVLSQKVIGIDEKEIIVIDDCSTDKTKEILQKLSHPSLQILYHKVNQGKGAALRTGFKIATGDILIIQDADLEYDPNEYSKLVKPILENKADVVFGSRFIGGEEHRVLYYWQTLTNQFLTFISNIFSDLNLTDMETGYKVFRKSVIDFINLEENRFGIEPELTAKVGILAREKGIRVYEVGISYYGRTYAEGKKIRFRDAVRGLWAIFLYNDSWFSHLVKYFLFGVIVALSQLVSIFILNEYFGYSTNEQLSTANVISILISFVVAFIIHSRITWRYQYRSNQEVVFKIILFFLVSTISLFVRIFLFNYLMEMKGMNYITNTWIGIFVSILINFIFYDKLVFKKNPINRNRN